MSWHAALHLPNLPLVAVRRADPRLQGRLLVLLGVRAGHSEVVASDVGLPVGMSERRARLRCPSAVFHPHAPERDAALVAVLRDALSGQSPRVVSLLPLPDPVLAADLGRVPLARAERELSALRTALRSRGVSPGFGLAATSFMAGLAARVAGPGEATVVPAGDEDAWLAPQPLDLLPLDADCLARLRQFGLRTVGAVAALPLDALEAQFGALGRTIRALAHGLEQPAAPEPLARVPLVIGWRFAGSVSDRAVIEAALRRIVARLVRRLLAGGCAARRLTLTLTSDDGAVCVSARDVAEPTSDPAHLAAMLMALLHATTPDAAIERVSVAATLTVLRTEQLALFEDSAAQGARLRTTIEGLAPRLAQTLLRAELADPGARCLEQRVALQRWGGR